MSRLDELIAEMCPDGVEYKKLGELEDNGFIKLGRGQVISKDYIRDNPGNYPVFSSSALNNGEIGRCGTFMFTDTRLTWSIDGGGKFFYRDNEFYSVTNVCGWLNVLNSNFINIRYLYHVLMNEWLSKKYDYINKAHPSVIRKEYSVPIPPLPIQEEIVRILDKFTALEAELEARKKQYEAYRDKLLNFNVLVGGASDCSTKTYVGYPEFLRKLLAELCPEGVENKPLADILRIRNGSDYKGFGEGDIPVYGTGGIMSFTDRFAYDKPSVLIPRKGSIDKVYYVDTPFWNVDTIFYTEINRKITLPRYVYYCLLSVHLEKLNKAGGVPSLTQSALNKVNIPVPPLPIQEEIVKILDKFEILCTGISSGIPAEIKSRHQQYEYYRDKLLTFNKLS